MSKHFYFIDPNGRFESEDKTVRYSLLKGKKAFDKLNERTSRFMRYQDDEDEILIEIKTEYQKDYRKHERREQYINDSKDKYEPVILSLDHAIEVDGEEVIYHDVIASDYNLEEEVLKREETMLLRKCLSALNKEEREMICHLYLRDEALTEAQYAALIGTSQQVINYRKTKILEKMKKILKSFC